MGPETDRRHDQSRNVVIYLHPLSHRQLTRRSPVKPERSFPEEGT
jgi:hypothetical protein